METPFLDRLIKEIKCHVELMTEAEMYEEIPEIKQELAEYEAIKKALAMFHYAEVLLSDIGQRMANARK